MPTIRPRTWRMSAGPALLLLLCFLPGRPTPLFAAATPTDTMTPSPTRTETATPADSLTPSPTPSLTPTVSVTATPTISPTSTITPTCTSTPLPVVFRLATMTWTPETLVQVAREFRNYPNPFVPGREHTTFAYTLYQDAEVWLEIHAYSGASLRAFHFGPGEEGGRGLPDGYTNRVAWDGRSAAGKTLGTGGYICRLTVRPRGSSATRIMTTKVGIVQP